jgi:asparagine synthase (glutamine-hydrolysing)
MLGKLASFGGKTSSISELPDAGFGVSPHVTLPEDELDRQPLVREDRWLLAADVRLDNREEICRTLGLDRRPVPDSEILFQALVCLGDRALDRIVGDFAFALFDAERKTLLLGRDATGQRPLYYATGNGFAAFASMPNALVGARGIGDELNFEAFSRALSDMPLEADSSYFSNIRKVRPGHFITIGEGGLRDRDYWHPRHAPGDRILRPDYIDAYRSLLDEVVQPRLRRKDGPVAAQLSSGLDSSAVASAAATLIGSANVLALTSAPAGAVQTASPRGRFGDESELAAQIASHLGIRHIVARDEGSAIAHLRAHAGLYQEPYRNNINAGWISRLAAVAREEGCEVMLTGDVGNLTLNCGNLANLGDFLEAGARVRWLREARLAMRGGRARWTGVLMNSFGHRLPPWAVKKLEHAFRGVDPRASSTFLRRAAVDKFIRSAPALRHEARTSNSYADRLAVLRSYDFGNHNKGILAETGIDLRHPLLDRRAVEFGLLVPPDQLFQNGRSRALARRALAGRLPDKILTMTDRGYQAADWQKRATRTELLAMVEEIESSSGAKQLIDTQRLKSTVERWDMANFDDPAVDYALSTYLPLALAGGLFILEAERGFPSLNHASAPNAAAT